MKKVGMSVSLSIKTVVRMEEYIEKHGGSFSRFVDIASNYYIDHNQTVSTISINDSIQDITPEPIEQPIEDTPKSDKPVNGDFNWDGVNID